MVLPGGKDTFRTLDDMEAFVGGPGKAEETVRSRQEAYAQIRKVPAQFSYRKQDRMAKVPGTATGIQLSRSREDCKSS